MLPLFLVKTPDINHIGNIAQQFGLSGKIKRFFLFPREGVRINQNKSE